MDAKDTGGPAFPRADYQFNGGAGGQEGMSLRDYFAAKAMQARLTDYESVVSMTEYAVRTGQDLAKVVADQSYDMADAMLRARSQA